MAALYLQADIDGYVEDEREDAIDGGGGPLWAAKIDTHFSVPMHMIDASVAFVRAAPHPVLTGQFGLFATAALRATSGAPSRSCRDYRSCRRRSRTATATSRGFMGRPRGIHHCG